MALPWMADLRTCSSYDQNTASAQLRSLERGHAGLAHSAVKTMPWSLLPLFHQGKQWRVEQGVGKSERHHFPLLALLKVIRIPKSYCI